MGVGSKISKALLKVGGCLHIGVGGGGGLKKRLTEPTGLVENPPPHRAFGRKKNSLGANLAILG